MSHTMRTRAKIFLHFSETSFSTFLRARWRHWKVRRPRCISSPWENLLQRWRERQSKILHDIYQREWYMMRGSLFSVSRYHPLYLTYLTWTCLSMPVLVLLNMLTKLILGSTCLYYTHPLESYFSILCVTLPQLRRPQPKESTPYLFPNHLFWPPKKSLDNEDHCLATTRRRVGRRTGPRMKRWSNSCHHLSPPLKPTECGGSSMRVFTLRLRCVLPRVGRKCNGDWHMTSHQQIRRGQRSILAALT